MKLTGIYKIKKEKIENDALILFGKGLTLRKIGAAVGKSHEWVREVIHKEYSKKEITTTHRPPRSRRKSPYVSTIDNGNPTHCQPNKIIVK